MKQDKRIHSSLYRYLMAGIAGVLLLYITLQYLAFRDAYEKVFLNEASLLEQQFQGVLRNYKITLEKIVTDIQKKDLFTDQKGIEDVLKKAYAYGIENSGQGNIRSAGVNWISVQGDTLNPIGRFGELKYALNLPANYLKKLETNWGQLEFSDVLEEGHFPEFPVLNLGIGIRDKNQEQRGFINARLDLHALKEALISKQKSGLQFILLDEKEREIFSSLPGDTLANKNQGITEQFKAFFKGNFFVQPYLFPLKMPVEGFPFVLRFGYDQNDFYLLFLKQNYLSSLLLCFVLCLFALLSHFYHKKLMKRSLRFYKENNREKNVTITRLTEDKHQLVKEAKESSNFIKSFENADREEKKFRLEINERISHSLSTMLDIANFLLNKIQEENNIKDDSKELMEVFEHTYTHSRFFTLKKEDALVSFNEVLDEVLLLLSKQILTKDLQIKRQQETATVVLTDRTALKQALLNIVGSAIKNSPRNGEIDIHLFLQGGEVWLECKDKGYLRENSSTSDKTHSLDCLSLEKPDLEQLIKSLGGTLSTDYKPYAGNTILLQLPYKMSKSANSDGLKSNMGNIISFPGLNK